MAVRQWAQKLELMKRRIKINHMPLTYIKYFKAKVVLWENTAVPLLVMRLRLEREKKKKIELSLSNLEAWWEKERRWKKTKNRVKRYRQPSDIPNLEV